MSKDPVRAAEHQIVAYAVSMALDTAERGLSDLDLVARAKTIRGWAADLLKATWEREKRRRKAKRKKPKAKPVLRAIAGGRSA